MTRTIDEIVKNSHGPSAFAKKHKVSRSTVHRWIKGVQAMRKKRAAAISRHYNVSAAALIRETSQFIK